MRQVWDLRTGSVFETFSCDGGITSLQFDASRIVCAAGTDDIKVSSLNSFVDKDAVWLRRYGFHENSAISASRSYYSI
jgi:hypothetical protein